MQGDEESERRRRTLKRRNKTLDRPFYTPGTRSHLVERLEGFFIYFEVIGRRVGRRHVFRQNPETEIPGRELSHQQHTLQYPKHSISGGLRVLLLL